MIDTPSAPIPSRAAYMRDYRARNTDARARERVASAARSAALATLAQLHPDDFARILDDERAQRGLPPKARYRPPTRP